MKKFFITQVFFLVLISLAQGQSCKNLPDKFFSYREAIRAIQSSIFKLTDELPAGKSSWIKSANYYSCDGYYGYLVFKTVTGREYIHENIPIKVWNEFRNASSSGSYYDRNIKGNYRLVPE